jgi:hypothetical protein
MSNRLREASDWYKWKNANNQCKLCPYIHGNCHRLERQLVIANLDMTQPDSVRSLKKIRRTFGCTDRQVGTHKILNLRKCVERAKKILAAGGIVVWLVHVLNTVKRNDSWVWRVLKNESNALIDVNSSYQALPLTFLRNHTTRAARRHFTIFSGFIFEHSGSSLTPRVPRYMFLQSSQNSAVKVL